MCYSRQVLKADRLRIQSSKSKAAIGCSVISRGTAGLVTLAAASQTSWSWHNTEEGFKSVSYKLIECPTRHRTVFLNGKAVMDVNR